MNSRIAMAVFVLMVALVLASGAAFAAGGVYLDDLQVTNDGGVTFFDTFDKANRGQWTSTSDISFVLAEGSTTQRLLCMNKHHEKDSAAIAYPKVTSAGLVEVTTKVFVTSPEEQYLYRNGKASAFNMIFHSAKPGYYMWAIVDLSAKAQANRVGIRSQYLTAGKQTGSAAFSQSPILKPSTWYALTLRLDPSSGTATVLLDGNPVATKPYNPGDYESISKLSILCSYGDGANIPK